MQRNRKGQIYLLAAIIISVAIYAITVTVNELVQERREGSFRRFSDNYEKESGVFLNSIFEQGNPFSTEEEYRDYIFNSFRNYTTMYTSYTKAINPEFGLVYALNYMDKIQIGNFMDKMIVVDTCARTTCNPDGVNGCYDKISATIVFEGLSLDPGGIRMADIENCTITIPYTSKIWVNIEDIWYPFEVQRNRPQIMIISRLEAGEHRNVYVGGEGFVVNDETKDRLEAFCSNKRNKNACESKVFCVWDGEECTTVW